MDLRETSNENVADQIHRTADDQETFPPKPLEIQIVNEAGSLQLQREGNESPNASYGRERKCSENIGRVENASYVLLSSENFDTHQEGSQLSVRKASVISQTNNLHILIKTESPMEQRVTILREDAREPFVDDTKKFLNPKRYGNDKERRHGRSTTTRIRKRNHQGRHHRKRKFMDKEDYMSTVVVIATIIGAIVGMSIVVSVGAWILKHTHGQ